MFGGHFQQSTGGTSLRNDTWIYDEDVNSWRILDYLDEHPNFRENLVLVEICKMHVIMINTRPNLENNWLFDGATLQWKKITVLGQKSSMLSYDMLITVKDVNTSCYCKEAVLAFPRHFHSDLNCSLLYELVCIEDAKIYS